jgi:hypothetical protein
VVRRWRRPDPPVPATVPATADRITDAEFGIEPPFTMGRDWERGVEYGLLFGRLKDHGSVYMAVHADLTEVVMRLAEHERQPFRAILHVHDADCAGEHDSGEDYMDVIIGRSRYGC